jgi:hypothetical protein
MAFLVWLLLGGSVVFWGLQLGSRPLPAPSATVLAGESGGAPVDLARLLGSTPVAAAGPAEVITESRLRLLGVVAPRSARAAEAGEGVALIEVDGVARTVRVGATVEGELRLLRVDARSASLGPAGGAPSQVLQISPQQAAATGALPPAAPSATVLGGNPVPAPVPAAMPSVYGAPPAEPVSPQQRAEGLPLKR